MARFFIHRPIFAWVLAIITMLAGGLALFMLPVAQYPEVAPPSIRISATYLGASASTTEEAVTQILEQNITGVDNMIYMKSTSDSNGIATITVSFLQGTDSDIAQVQVQNKIQTAINSLPESVQRLGVKVDKGNSNTLMVVALTCTDGTLDSVDLADYMGSYIKDQISRLPGVGSVQIFGDQYAMRIWLDPQKLYDYNMTASDVVGAISAQNAQVTAGQLGSLPAEKTAQINVVIKGQNLLQTVQEFEDILLRVDESGRSVFLKDVGRVEVGSTSYNTTSEIRLRGSGAMGISLASGANALDVKAAVTEKLDELREFLPENMKLIIPYDTTPPIRASVSNVVHTLFEAIVLVFLIMYLFLQNIRATIIPTIAVPVVLLGTFAILLTLGFSINTLSLFAMVLAIGLLVDDAIVVVENVERLMATEKLGPVEAAEKSMDQVSGALVGIVAVLCAVFLPMAFLKGSTGVIYRQFSVTIVTAMLMSLAVALILTPALCATILKQHGHEKKVARFFEWFNGKFERFTAWYHEKVISLLRQGGKMLIAYAIIIVALVGMYLKLPTSFLPDEDAGLCMGIVSLPPNSTRAQTMAVLEDIQRYAIDEEGVLLDNVIAVAGFGMGPQGQNVGVIFVSLKDWSERKGKADSAFAFADRMRKRFANDIRGSIYIMIPPAIIELGTSTGFTLELQDNGGLGHERLIAARNQLMMAAFQNPKIAYVRPTGLEDSVQYEVSFDYQKASSLGLSVSEISNNLAIMLGGMYVNDFLDRGRIKKVYVQGDSPFRMTPDDLLNLSFRNNQGKMVPFSSIAHVEWTQGPAMLERYNGISSVEIQGVSAPGVTSGEAMKIMEEEVAKLGQGFGLSWTGMSYEEEQAGNQTTIVLAISALIVFLALAALYESWTIPFSVILMIPIGVLGAVLGTFILDLSNDIYFQVGLLATMGLSAKNAIMVVEFAKDLMEKEGKSYRAAAAEAARLRLRPILMTSLAFGLGVIPLLLASGAGAASQLAVGGAVFFGTVTATSLGIFFIPTFFAVVAIAVGLFFKKISVRELFRD